VGQQREKAKVEQFRFADDGAIPNNPALPLLVYRGVLDLAGDAATKCEERFASNGWSGGFRAGVYGFHHYHSTAHEVLGIVSGAARVRFGGESGETVSVQAGDVVVVPAGVGHKNEGTSGDLLVIGAYPGGRGPDMCRGRASERPRVIDNIKRVALPEADPVYGDGGPLIESWSQTT
jgi:uncharacterized protein YjlB